MTTNEIYELAGAIVISVGGAAVILTGIFYWMANILKTRIVEKVKAELQAELERQKTKLRKSEFIFQKEFEAASAFMALRRKIIPDYSHPDMDFHEACEKMASDFGKVARQLTEFVSIHGAALNKRSLELLNASQVLAETNQFELAHEGAHYTPNSTAIKAAEELWDNLKNIETSLVEAVHSQAAH